MLSPAKFASLPPEIILSILSATLEDFGDPLSSPRKKERYAALLPLALVSRLLQDPVSYMLSRHLAIADAQTGEAFCHSRHEISPHTTISLLLYGSGGGAECTGVSAELAQRILALVAGLQRLKLVYIGRLDERFLTSPSLAQLTSLELHTHIAPSPTAEALVFPTQLESLLLSTWNYPALFIPRLLAASSSTLTSLSISLSATTPDLPEILTQFAVIAPRLISLDLSNFAPLPTAFFPLLGTCKSLRSIKTGRVMELEASLSLLKNTELRSITSRISPDQISEETIAILRRCLSLEGVGEVTKWNLGARVDEGRFAVVEGAKEFFAECATNGVSVVYEA